MNNFYDVCNDYSIKKRDKPSDLKKYKAKERVIQGQQVTLYFHKQYDELHYVSSDAPLKFRYVH